MSAPKRPPNGWPWERPDWNGFGIGWPPEYAPQPLPARSDVDMREAAARARQVRLDAGDTGTMGLVNRKGHEQESRADLGRVKLPGRPRRG